MSNRKLKTIKTIAGEILIYLYNRQRKEAFTFKMDTLRFSDALIGVGLEGDGEFQKMLLHAANNSNNDAYNALDYLKMCGFIEYEVSADSGGESLHNFHVTDKGIDIIEGVERDEAARNAFNVTFNFKVAETMNVESLVKNEIESLVKASVL